MANRIIKFPNLRGKLQLKELEVIERRLVVMEVKKILTKRKVVR